MPGWAKRSERLVYSRVDRRIRGDGSGLHGARTGKGGARANGRTSSAASVVGKKTSRSMCAVVPMAVAIVAYERKVRWQNVIYSFEDGVVDSQWRFACVSVAANSVED